MNSIKVLLLALFLLTSAVASATSAIRYPGESYEEALWRNTFNSGHGLFRSDESAHSNGQKLTEVDLTQINSLSSYEEVVAYYEYVRDKKFIEHKQTMRRSSWFYPDNGCWLRAQLMNENLREYDDDALAKIFIFGNLNVETQFSSRGYVSWWYHVAVITRVDDEYFVLDPALDYSRPLPLEEWIGKQVEDINSANISICHPDTFSPGKNCFEPVRANYDSVILDQIRFLNYEEERLTQLGFPVEEFLGDLPPWRSRN